MTNEPSSAAGREREPYEAPTVEDVPVSPDERLLVPCKAAGSFNPLCGGTCDSCSSPGS